MGTRHQQSRYRVTLVVMESGEEVEVLVTASSEELAAAEAIAINSSEWMIGEELIVKSIEQM
jgi:hypothetical protein